MSLIHAMQHTSTVRNRLLAAFRARACGLIATESPLQRTKAWSELDQIDVDAIEPLYLVVRKRESQMGKLWWSRVRVLHACREWAFYRTRSVRSSVALALSLWHYEPRLTRH